MRLIFLIISMLYSFWTTAQKSINFTQLLTFGYQGDGTKSEFSVFLEPKTGTWLLTKDDTFSGKVEDTELWVLKSDGRIILLGTDHNGKRQKITYQNNAFKFSTGTLKAKPTGKTQVFGQNTSGWKILQGTEYKAIVGRTESRFFARLMPYDCRALLAYNACVDMEHHPYGLGGVEYYKILPSKYLLLQDSYLKLISISPTEYWVDL